MRALITSRLTHWGRATSIAPRLNARLLIAARAVLWLPIDEALSDSSDMTSIDTEYVKETSLANRTAMIYGTLCTYHVIWSAKCDELEQGGDS